MAMTRTELEFKVNDVCTELLNAPALDKLFAAVTVFGASVALALWFPTLAAVLYLGALIYLAGWRYGHNG